jgi:hypothetical protein
MSYNGWSNRDTWEMEATLSNIESKYTLASEIAKGIMEASAPGAQARAASVSAVGKTFKTYFGGSARINWQEIAESWTAQYPLDRGVS